jgi:hypothetical protein
MLCVVLDKRDIYGIMFLNVNKATIWGRELFPWVL